MLRLYLRFYVALVASLVLFAVATAALWHFAGGPAERASETLSRLVQNALPNALAPAAEQQEALRRLAAGLGSNVTLYDRNGGVIAAIGQPLLAPRASGQPTRLFSRGMGGNVSAVRMADGRLLVASVPLDIRGTRSIFHLMLLLLIAAVGVVAFPIVRQLTRRLERLQHGVESLGAGDLTARVAVEGRDEIGRLAGSFNRAAGQIEQLMRAHQSLLANASHELRTPLARIRLAVEMLKTSADAKTKAGLEQDIAELDALVDEILLASRLDAVKQIQNTEDIDLLALAAEECSRYDDVQLEGTPITLRGDARLLRRLLRNLLENAKRHGKPPTLMRVTHDEATARLTVWDSGSGPQQAEFERLFTPFYRPSNGRNGPGTGLGLALVRQIARLHGGEARCAAIDEGRSGFVVTLAR